MNIFDPTTQGSDPQGRYIDRNVAAGIFGTVINATVFNQIGDESNNLIKAAGLMPSDKEVDQWLKAIQKLYGDADSALKQELISKIDALTASDIAFNDSISISASDVQNAIVALHTLIKALKAEDISFDDSISLGASNVQEMGVKLNEKLDTEIDNLQTQIDTLTNATIIADGEEHPTSTYYQNAEGARKPLYYKYITETKTTGTILLDSNYADKIFVKNFEYNTGDARWWLFGTMIYPYTQNETVNYGIYFYGSDNTVRVTYSSKYKGLRNIHLEYTKTSDSWEY